MKPRILIALAGLALLVLFIKPIWYVTLIAPQYPDGVTLHLYIDKIGGETPGTLQNINILNHYVGMKAIEPESIPELRYFPWVVGGFAALALIAAFIHRRWLYLGWTAMLLVALGLGVYDFYLWEYDYGHSLNPNAPMKFPGESFQPPLIGNKAIINFVAKSYPHVGGYAAAAALLLGAVATCLSLRRKPKHETTISPAAAAFVS